MPGLGCGLGAYLQHGGASWAPAALAAGRSLRYHPGRVIGSLGPTSGGAGTVTNGAAVGWWQDQVTTADAGTRTADPAVQATSGRRPTVSFHASGKGFSVNGSGGAGAGGNFLAGSSAVTGANAAVFHLHHLAASTLSSVGHGKERQLADVLKFTEVFDNITLKVRLGCEIDRRA